MPETLFSIAAVSGALKVHRQTLRNLEKKKLIFPLWVGKRRIYTPGHIRLCEKIKQFSDKGVPLKIIKKMLDTGDKLK